MNKLNNKDAIPISCQCKLYNARFDRHFVKTNLSSNFRLNATLSAKKSHPDLSKIFLTLAKLCVQVWTLFLPTNPDSGRAGTRNFFGELSVVVFFNITCCERASFVSWSLKKTFPWRGLILVVTDLRVFWRHWIGMETCPQPWQAFMFAFHALDSCWLFGSYSLLSITRHSVVVL